MNKLIVAIDGPSGAGKSTLSKLLARRLDYLNIDTGAMYRSVAWAARQQGVDPADEDALAALCGQLDIDFIRMDDGERVMVNGHDVSSAIRTPEISLLTARVSACPAVRNAMVEQQRRLGRAGGVVLEGRDIGSVVFPQAEVKFYLSATAAARGRRRFEELRQKGAQVDLEQTIREVEARDAADMQRTHAPLVQTEDAIAIDSTQLTIDEVLEQMLRTIRQKRSEQLKYD